MPVYLHGRFTGRRRQEYRDGGYAMVALLVGLGVMAVTLSVALPAWRTLAQREREAELVFRGEQYARAIALYQRRFANAFPPTVDLLVEQRFLRRKYLDPVTGAEFQPLYVGEAGAGQPGPGGGAQAQQGRGTAPAPLSAGPAPLGARGGIMGVTSRSDAMSLREYNGRTRYNEWTFVAVEASTRAGAPQGSQAPTGGVTPGDGRGRDGGAPFGTGGRGEGRGQLPPGAPRGGGGPQPLGGGPRGGRF